MSSGKVEAIFIGPERKGPMKPVGMIHAEAGRGLEGDRYWLGGESAPGKSEPDRQVTLFEAEAIEALRRECGVELDPSESRRNIMTRGVALNHLVGREFQVGGVRLRGIRLCEPCKHLESMTRPGVLNGLIHRGGLRAEILSEGVVRAGDPVEV